MKKYITIFFGLFLLVTPQSVAANSNDATAFVLDERAIFTPVDNATWCGDCIDGEDFTTGSPWTINPGWVPGYIPPIITTAQRTVSDGCLWDQDDYFSYLSQGNVLGARTTLTLTECHWYTAIVRYGWTGGTLNYLVWWSSSPDLKITYRWNWDTGSRTYTLPPPVRDGNQWKYLGCLVNPPPTNGTFINVPDSHDGRAVWQLQTVTITNPTSHKTSKTGGLVGSDMREAYSWCKAYIEV